jgi:N-acetylglucosaminyldiphosphoundecaprenol N-acetyl-beta-D-mannosaminyltransferase
MSPNIAQILKVRINSTSVGSVLSQILDFVANPRLERKLVIFTPNPEFLVAAHKDAEFRQVLNQADINWPEGFGLVLAGKLLGQPIKERVGGASLVERLLEIGNRDKWKVGIVGARRGVREETEKQIRKLQQKYPGLTIVNLEDYQSKISNLKFQIVLACQGMEKQERWIIENKDKINAKVFMGVGGSLDFLTGFSQRAPIWMQAVGLEWLWRALQRPKHLKRAWDAVVVFPLLVLKEKVSSISKA